MNRPQVRIGDSLREAAETLAKAGIPHARLDARVLMTHALGGPLERLIQAPDLVLPAAAEAAYRRLVKRRARREPVSRIVGRREFWSLDFMLSPATLDPRADSETVVEAALAASPPGGPAAVLDLGTGSGCLLLAFLSERPLAAGLGIDLSPEAVETAARNARNLALADRARFQVGDWGSELAGIYDLILCNPPYIPEKDIGGLAPEVVRHDPVLALAGGADGLAHYRRLSSELARLLGPDGAAVIEIGQGQAAAVEEIMATSGLATVGRRADLGGIVRALTLRHERQARNSSLT